MSPSTLELDQHSLQSPIAQILGKVVSGGIRGDLSSPGVLLFHLSFDLRVKHLGKRLSDQMGEHTNPRMMNDLARRDDREKAGRMRYLHEVNVRDPALYDLVINTEKLSIDAAVELIAGVLQGPDMAASPAGQQIVADRALASRVQLALATHPETRRHRITVEARTGVVTLEGTAAMDEAVDVARGVVGVGDVKTRQVDIPPVPPFAG